MPLHPTFSPRFPRIFHKSKKWAFSGKVFCADSEYMPDVSNGPVLAEKIQKLFFWLNFQKVENFPKRVFLGNETR
jgi:hypothetical protein